MAMGLPNHGPWLNTWGVLHINEHPHARLDVVCSKGASLLAAIAASALVPKESPMSEQMESHHVYGWIPLNFTAPWQTNPSGGMHFAAPYGSGSECYSIWCHWLPLLFMSRKHYWYIDQPVTSLRYWSLRWYLIFRAPLAPYTYRVMCDHMYHLTG